MIFTWVTAAAWNRFDCTKVKNNIVGDTEIIMPNMPKNVNNSGFLLSWPLHFHADCQFMNTIAWTQTIYIHMAWHEADQNITPSIHRKWNTKINTMFLFTIHNQWYFIDLDVKGQGQINIMFVDVLYS